VVERVADDKHWLFRSLDTPANWLKSRLWCIGMKAGNSSVNIWKGKPYCTLYHSRFLVWIWMCITSI